MRRQNCLLAKDSGQTLQTCSSAMTFLDLELYHFFKMLMVLVQRDSKNSKKTGNSGANKQNCSRDITRKLLRRCRWPSLYHAKVRVWDPRKQRLTHCNLPLLLPHDIIYNMLKHGASLEALLSKEGFTIEAAEHLAHARQELQCHQLLGLGLWMDGVPCNWDRSQSVETVCISFPGLEGQWNNLRVPLVSINKKFVVKQQTFDDISRFWQGVLHACPLAQCQLVVMMPLPGHSWTPPGKLLLVRQLAAKECLQKSGGIGLASKTPSGSLVGTPMLDVAGDALLLPRR